MFKLTLKKQSTFFSPRLENTLGGSKEREHRGSFGFIYKNITLQLLGFTSSGDGIEGVLSK